ncbi:MAG: prepilin peptidase [Gammaproteobacteria bacterium]|nr:prepilin peptidase [Gammaproteobacteria bacterium]
MNDQLFLLACLGSVLSVAVYTDIYRNRIENKLTFPAALIGMTLNAFLPNGLGFESALIGFLLGLVCFLPFYIAGGMAAGDVKLMGAVGAFVGFPLILKAVLISLICGSILGIAWLVRFKGIGDFLHRYFLVGKHSLMTGSLQYIPPAKGTPALLRFPYALAIACGTTVSLWMLS